MLHDSRSPERYFPFSRHERHRFFSFSRIHERKKPIPAFPNAARGPLLCLVFVAVFLSYLAFQDGLFHICITSASGFIAKNFDAASMLDFTFIFH